MKLSKEARSGRGKKGSQFHLQSLVNKNPELLNSFILEANSPIRSQITGSIRWVSPLENENYVEYQDEEFLSAVGYPELSKELFNFWPQGGPVWDALGVVNLKEKEKKGIILLEAKSYIKEMESNGCGAQGESRRIIEETFKNVQNFIGISANSNWTEKYYQYANRLAHLYFLWILQKIPTWLIFVYFVNDREQKGPCGEEEWQKAISEAKQTLGLSENHLLSGNVINIFPNLGKGIKNG